MNKEDVMEQAREFAKKSLQGSIEKVEKKDYFMFLISRFLLLKEAIVKKDSDNNVLYFNYNRSKDYLPMIKIIVDYIKRTGRIEKNSTTVVINPRKYNDSSLHFYIWAFNKLRDCFSHGMYEFDLDNDQIIINNDHSEERDPYALVVNLPIELLELFTYIPPKRTTHFDEKAVKEFEELVELERYKFFHQTDYIKQKIDPHEYIKIKQSPDLNVYNNGIDNNIYKISITDNIKDFKALTDYINNINYSDIQELSKNQEDTLEMLLEMVRNSEVIDEEQTSIVISYFRQLGLLDETEKTRVPRIKKNEHPDEEYTNKLATVINEISSIIGINLGQINNMLIPALYNYMQLTFALTELDFKKKENRKTLGYLKMRKLHPVYIKTNDRLIEENIDSQYSIKLKAIQNYTDIFIMRITEKLEQYKMNPNPGFRDAINEFFKKFYEEIIDSFADKNAFVLISIRNAIEHANFFNFTGSIVLNDQNNQNDVMSINFGCEGTAEDYFEITNCLEMGNAEKRFTFDDFLEELKTVIETRTFNELIDVINQLKLINQEALISVLNQSMSR